MTSKTVALTILDWVFMAATMLVSSPPEKMMPSAELART